MKKFVCPVCGYVHEAEVMPEGFKCPLCKVPGEKFKVMEAGKLAAEHEYGVYGKTVKNNPDISLATVYRNLALFKQQGLIQSLGTVDGIERFDGNVDPHVHFICSCCHAVIDLPQIDVPEQLRSTAEAAIGGRILDCQLSFTGICQSCCQNEKTA